jgi:ADP-heptose:LPS heptosyltransferase
LGLERRFVLFKSIELKGKELLFRVLKLFLKSAGEESLEPKDVDLHRIKKILVVRQDDRIGNLILTTPLLSALRRSFPKAEIWYLASQTFHTLFSRSRLVDRILVARKRLYIFHPLALLLFIRKIRRQRFDLAIDASDENNFSLNNSFLVLLSGASYRIGYEKPRSSLFLNLQVPPSQIRRHASETYLDLFRYLVGDVQSNDLRVNVDPERAAAAEAYLERKGVKSGDFLVGMHIGGRLGKRWQPENFRELAAWLTSTLRAKVIVFWGPEEKAVVRQFGKNNSHQIISDLFGLPMLAALIQRCGLFISPDTGAMHLSVAVGTPTLALFLDSDEVKFGPQGTKHRVLTASDGTLSVETVKKAVQEMTKSRLPVSI